MIKPVGKQADAKSCLDEIAKLALAEDGITEAYLWGRLNYAGGTIPPELLQRGPEGQPHPVLAATINFFLSDPRATVKMNSGVIDYFNWGSHTRRLHILRLFKDSRSNFAQRNTQTPTSEPPVDSGFGVLLKHVYSKSGLLGYEAAHHFRVGHDTLIAWSKGTRPVPLRRMQMILSILDKDMEGPKLFSAYPQYRERMKPFVPEVENLNALHVLLNLVIVESHKTIEFAARFFESSVGVMETNLRGVHKISNLRAQIIFQKLEEDIAGEGTFTAYPKYRRRIAAAITPEDTNSSFPKLLKRVLDESGKTIRFAATQFGMNARGLQSNINGNKTMSREKAARIITSLEQDQGGPKNFLAFEEHRDDLISLSTALPTALEISRTSGAQGVAIRENRKAGATSAGPGG